MATEVCPARAVCAETPSARGDPAAWSRSFAGGRALVPVRAGRTGRQAAHSAALLAAGAAHPPCPLQAALMVSLIWKYYSVPVAVVPRKWITPLDRLVAFPTRVAGERVLESPEEARGWAGGELGGGRSRPRTAPALCVSPRTRPAEKLGRLKCEGGRAGVPRRRLPPGAWGLNPRL